MTDVVVTDDGAGGRLVRAGRRFAAGEVVIAYVLQPLTFEEFQGLSAEDHRATHTVDGQIYLYPEPARYVRHSEDPNTVNDHARRADVALRDIEPGEVVTVDARLDDVPVLLEVAAVLVRVPSIEAGLLFYRDRLGQQTLWRRDDMAAVRLGDSELVLTTRLNPETDLLVASVDHAVRVVERAGGRVVLPPEDIDVGRVAVVEDPFGNRLTLVGLPRVPIDPTSGGTS
jgi:catechol 2,3-dioxygenase-like lactoylglutathione lyase family enzyme